MVKALNYFYEPQYIVLTHFADIFMALIDFCLQPGKIDALKMLDLQTKSAINSDNV